MKTLATTTLLLLALTGCNKEAPATVTPEPSQATTSTSAQDISNARAFLSHIYAGYHPDAGLDAILPDEAVYTPALIAAMQANSDAYAGEVGYLDGDPLCDCQDTAQDLRQLSFDIQPLADGQLRASAQLDDPEHPLQLQLTLQRQGGSWRIADIANARAPSLLQALERDTATAKQAAGQAP
ncbi:DUF3828 domain-containing protein [Stenotrophomonas sp. PS02298]|uniref:DUF3828 domain-containing protein n=1 Tax=Stenotrophomonas sp. PS02298 TaxID=2991424 RepID=UPI00249B2777|nr:DUF3828 domain-containing protein [Stenotrophomonas sp. PS02298]